MTEKLTECPAGAFTSVLTKNGGADILVLFRHCTAGDLDEILALQDAVYSAVPDKETFVLTTREEMTASVAEDVAIGAYLSNRLVAFTLIVTGSHNPRHLGFVLGYDDEKRTHSVTYDTTFVHPDYTGYGFQRMFLTIKDRTARALGAREALATVSPKNAPSLRNLMADGFVVAGEKKMYKDLSRYVMKKSL